MTLDGKVATAKGESRWITGPRARQDAHRLRSRVDACDRSRHRLHDNPTLTARLSDRPLKLASQQPFRIVVDSRLRTPIQAQVLPQQDKAKTIIATTAAAPAARRSVLQKKGIEILTLPALRGRVSFPALITQLGKRGIMSLLMEGGSTVNAAMLKAKLIDHIRLYMAPTLIGGQDAKGMIGGGSPERLAGAIEYVMWRHDPSAMMLLWKEICDRLDKIHQLDAGS